MIVSAIVAVDNHYAIGKDNQIPWYLPADLKYFKKKTIHHPVIMGRKTFQSIGRPLPKRTNIVLTRNPFFTASGVFITHSLEEAIQLAEEQATTEIFIIGGEKVYEMAWPMLQRIYLTEVDTITEEATAFFPIVNFDDWTLVSEETHQKDDKNPYNYTFKILEK